MNIIIIYRDVFYTFILQLNSCNSNFSYHSSIVIFFCSYNLVIF